VVKWFLLTFMFCSSSFIIHADAVVISGQPGPLLNERHFLENGLDRSLKNRNLFKRLNRNERVYWIVFNCSRKKRGGYSEEILNEYTEKANKENISVIVMNSSKAFTKWLNAHSLTSDSTVKISRFHYYGHATLGNLAIGYVNSKIWNKWASKKLRIGKILPDCFSDSAEINLVGGCRTAIAPRYLGKKSVADRMIHLTNGKIYASDVRVFYPGGPVSDKTLVKKNNGKIITVDGNKMKRIHKD